MFKGSRNHPVLAFVSNSCWSVYNFRLDIIRQFLQDGFVVLIIAPKDAYTEKLLSLSKIGEIKYKEILFQNSVVHPFSDWMLYRQLLQIYKAESPDIIFHYVTKPVIYGSMAAGKLGIPSVAVITGLGYVYIKDSLLSTIVSSLFRFSLRKTMQVWFLNEENALLFEKKNIISKQKIRILPGEGINTERFKPSVSTAGNTFVFIMVSRLLWSKGVGCYVEAARMLKARGIAARFYLLGKLEAVHPDAVGIETIQDWDHAGLIEYLGESDEVPDHLGKADCFVLPTYYQEGVPRSIMEAASMELPVIASRQTGCNLVVQDGITGYLFDSKDPLDLAHTMEKVMMLDPPSRKEMGKKGRELMQSTFHKDIVINIYQETVREFLS